MKRHDRTGSILLSAARRFERCADADKAGLDGAEIPFRERAIERARLSSRGLVPENSPPRDSTGALVPVRETLL